MLNLHRAVLSACLVAAAAGPLYAQSEAELKDFFEGKSVRVKIDMPASQEGIDVFPDARRPMDFAVYSTRVKTYGISVRNGESVMITKVRVKEKLIEFQLAGGGYGTFGDDTGNVSAPTVSKSNREKDLERMIKDERDATRKRRLQRELDDLRAERAREDARNKATASMAAEAKKSRIADARLHGGSRFNIRYQNGVPGGLDAGGIMRALDEWVEFPFATDRRPAASSRPPASSRPAPREDLAPPPGGGDIRKGMLLADVERILGRAEKSTPRNEGTLRVISATFSRGDQIVTAEFVEGVLIKYSIASK
jgi:hypothetical protein